MLEQRCQWYRNLKSERLNAFSVLEGNLEGLEQNPRSTVQGTRHQDICIPLAAHLPVMRNSRTKQSQPAPLSSDKASVSLVIPSLNVI